MNMDDKFRDTLPVVVKYYPCTESSEESNDEWNEEE